MTSNLSYLAANERATDMRRAAAESHLAATANIRPEQHRTVRHPSTPWWRVVRRLTTP